MFDRVDHMLLNCRDSEVTVAWHERARGFQREEFGPERRTAPKFGISLRSLPTGKHHELLSGSRAIGERTHCDGCARRARRSACCLARRSPATVMSKPSSHPTSRDAFGIAPARRDKAE